MQSVAHHPQAEVALTSLHGAARSWAAPSDSAASLCDCCGLQVADCAGGDAADGCWLASVRNGGLPTPLLRLGLLQQALCCTAAPRCMRFACLRQLSGLSKELSKQQQNRALIKAGPCQWPRPGSLAAYNCRNPSLCLHCWQLQACRLAKACSRPALFNTVALPACSIACQSLAHLNAASLLGLPGFQTNCEFTVKQTGWTPSCSMGSSHVLTIFRSL